MAPINVYSVTWKNSTNQDVETSNVVVAQNADNSLHDSSALLAIISINTGVPLVSLQFVGRDRTIDDGMDATAIPASQDVPA